MVVATDYPFMDAIWTMIVFFGFVIWLWVLFAVFADVFRRDDIGGWAKAGWTALVIFLPLLGVLIYMIAEGRNMAERRAREIKASQAQYDEHIRTVAAGGVVGELSRAKELLDSGAITQEEYDRIKAAALANGGAKPTAAAR